MIEDEGFEEVFDHSDFNIENDPDEVFILNVFDGESNLVTNYVASTFQKAMEITDVITGEDETIEAVTIKRHKLDALNNHETLH